ncbi:hypothetical protein OOZ15_19490 [Galbibacter sp. EGI 63066]|uniref:hypothetical protein n=1 Tax=Galbibacter sp. EGI 63066 TaxID=2993559 RepID=UPI00224978B4|nr:hypothetical protein [Galbibacter sp. EGI 63066]MCX2682139.1 hypothetical protein [Galbibacter sp. EGI 63066]
MSGIAYDKNGNITALQRKGKVGSSYNTMDDLTYNYYNGGNFLVKVNDGSNNPEGFKDGTNSDNDYGRDANGNTLRDRNKGITGIAYNHLNMPTKITVTGTNSGVLDYKYSADGTKLRKIKNQGGNVTTTDYAGNYIYENNLLKQVSHPEGYFEPKSSGGYQYVYYLKDHQSNVRITYADENRDGAVGTSEIRREQNYYPFGLEHKGYNIGMYGVKNNLKTFQDQEFTEDLGLNTHEWRYRISDPAIGRFWQVDPLAEDYVHNGVYNFSENRVVDAVELEGLESVLVIDKDERPQDDGTSGTTYTGETYYLNEETGEVNGPYSSSTYPNSKSNSDNSTKYNTLNEGEHKYNNRSGHKGGTKKGLNIDDKGDRKTDGKDPEGNDVTMQYVNYHSGASDNGNYNSRGSAGCITCDPDDAEAFFNNFNWTNSSETKGDSSGTINVVRGDGDETDLHVLLLKIDGKIIQIKNYLENQKKK